MIEKKINGFTKLCFGAALASQLLVSQAFAQVDVEPILMQVNQVEVKPGMLGQYNEMHREIWMPNQRSNDVAWRVTNRTVLGNTMMRIVTTPLADMEAVGAELSAALQIAGTRTLETMTSRRSFVMTTRPDMSMAGIPNPGLSVLIHFQLNTGKDAAFKTYFVETVLPAMAASGVVGAQMFQTTMGGPTGEFWLTVPQASFAALDGPGPFSSVTAAQGARMTAAGADLFDTWETSLIAVDQGLSYGLPGLQP